MTAASRKSVAGKSPVGGIRADAARDACADELFRPDWLGSRSLAERVSAHWSPAGGLRMGPGGRRHQLQVGISHPRPGDAARPAGKRCTAICEIDYRREFVKPCRSPRSHPPQRRANRQAVGSRPAEPGPPRSTRGTRPTVNPAADSPGGGDRNPSRRVNATVTPTARKNSATAARQGRSTACSRWAGPNRVRRRWAAVASLSSAALELRDGSPPCSATRAAEPAAGASGLVSSAKLVDRQAVLTVDPRETYPARKPNDGSAGHRPLAENRPTAATSATAARATAPSAVAAASTSAPTSHGRQ